MEDDVPLYLQQARRFGGTGRITLLLVQVDFAIISLDIEEDMFKWARQKGKYSVRGCREILVYFRYRNVFNSSFFFINTIALIRN